MPFDRAALARRAREAQAAKADGRSSTLEAAPRPGDPGYRPRGTPQYYEGDIERKTWAEWLPGFEWRGADGSRDAQHITIIAKNGDGKSHLANELERAADKPKVVVWAAKPPGDPALEALKRQGYRHVTRWPWRTRFGVRTGPQLDENGRARLLFWPKIRTVRDLPQVRGLFAEALDDVFAGPWVEQTGSGWVERTDEGIYMTRGEFLNMRLRLEDHWQRVRSQDTSHEFLCQRSATVPLLAYDQIEHLFAARCNDRRDAERVGEMMGTDRLMVRDALATLAKYEFLHMDREAGTLTIIKAPAPRGKKAPKVAGRG